MNSRTKVRDKVRDGTDKIRKTTKKLNSKIMEKVKIKRVKRNKKKTTTGEKVLAAVGLGSTLLGGAGAVSSQPKATQCVRTQESEKGSKTQGIKDKLKEIFGIKKAKAAGSVEGAQQALSAAQNALSNFDAWVASATADVPLFAPEDQAARQQEIDAEVARTRPGLEQAVSAAQAEYDQAVQDAQGPHEGDTRSEGGLSYTFYQGGWVLNNGQTKTENGISYGSEGGQWILLDGQSKTENGVRYISSGGQWVEQAPEVQGPQIGDTKTGPDGYQYVFSNSIYPTGAWTLADGQTKTENGRTYLSSGGQWIEQQTGPHEGDTKTENGLGYHFSNGQWIDDAGNRVQNPNSFWYIADGNGDWTLANGQSKSEGGFQYGSLGGGWILLDGQTKTENGMEYISSGGQWVEKPAGVEAPKIGDVQTGADGYQYVFSDSLYPTGAWTLVDGQTKTENGKNYIVQGGAWVQEQTGAQEGDTKTENGLSYHFTGGQWVDDAGNRVQNPNSFWYIADGSGGWTLEDGQTKTESGKTYKVIGGQWVEQQAETVQPKEGDVKSENGKSYKFTGGVWIEQTPENTPKINYEVWRTDQGVGAYYNEQYGFVTLTNDGRLVDQNGNLITESIVGNYQLQGLMFQLNSARQNNTVQNPDFKPATPIASLTGQALIDQANNGGVDWNKLTPAQQQELASYFGNHPELLPQSITPGSSLAYMLGLGTSTDVNDPTVKANAEKAGLEFKDGQWTKKAAPPTIIFTTNSGNTTTPKVGDSWTITITGPVGAPVFSTANGSTTQMGVIGADGKLVLTGTFKAGDVGTWNQQWTVGEGTAQLQAGNVDFQLVASQSTQVEQTVPFGQETLSFTVKDNGNGTFSIIYNGTVLVTGSSKADIDAARAKFPFMYSTPEAVVLSTVSNGFNNYFITTGSQVKLDNGTRTTVSTTENREVFRDSNGNAAAYFNEFGGRIYFDKATGDLYHEDKDGNYVKMGLGEISPQTRQNIINALTGTGANIKVTTVTHNLLSELGQPTKGPNLKQDPKDGNWYVIDSKGDYVLDANGKRIQANLQRFVWSPGGWSSWGYNVEGLNEEMAKYASKQYTVDVVTAPNGTKTYTLTAILPDGKPVSRTFMNSTEFNNFLATNFTTSNAFMDMSPADKAIFMAATDARIRFPELTAAFIGNTPAAPTNHRIIWQNPNNGMLQVQGLINPTYMSTYQQAQSLQSLFPGSQIKERLPLGWPGVMAYEYDPSDPRRVYEVILSDGTVLNVSHAMGSIKQDGQTLTVQGFPQNVINQLNPPAGTKVNALFVGGVGYGSADDNARAAAGLVEPGSFAPSANPTYSGAIIPLTWLNLGNGQGGIVDPASPYTTNLQNGLNPNQGVVNTGVTPTTTTTSTSTILNNLFTLPVNVGGGSAGGAGTGGSLGGNTGGTGTGVDTGTQQTAIMPSISKVSSLDLKAGGTVQITGQNITQGTTLVELLNRNGKVVGLTVNSVSGNIITATLPQAGLETGQYTLQFRFVGTGANFGKVSSGVVVNVQGSATTVTTGTQTGQQLAVGEKLGTNIVSGAQASLTHVAVFTNGDVNTLGKVSPGNVIEIGGQGLSGYDKFGLIVNGQEYEVKKFLVSDSTIKLTVPTNLPASIPSGADVQVKLYSSSSSVAQGVVQQKLSYKNTTNQDNQTAVEDDEVEAVQDEATETGSGYDPTKYVTTLEEAVAPVGITVYGGADYVPSHWTRFTNTEDVNAYQEARNKGFKGWVGAIANGLKASGYVVDVVWEGGSNKSGFVSALSATINISKGDIKYSESFSLYHYDTFTKGNIDPVKSIISRAANTPDNQNGDEVEVAADEETEAESEVEATTDDEGIPDAETEESEGDASDKGLETDDGEEAEAVEDEGGGSGNKTLAVASKEEVASDEAEAVESEETDIDEETAEVAIGGGQNASNSGGSVQLRGAVNGIRGAINTLGSADQAWNGGLKMPAGYPASSGTAGLTVQNSTYKVKKGDTLWAIAKKHYGDGKKWRKILEANLDKVKDPKKLKIGAELVIPKL